MGNKSSGKILKYPLVILSVVIVVIACFILKKELLIRTLDSTDLSSLKINDIKLKQNIHNIDLTKYIKNNDFEDRSTKDSHYQYFEDFYIVYDNNGNISRLQTLSDNGLLDFHGGVNDLNDVEDNLGKSYIVQDYDSDQGLTSRVYYDKINRTKAIFVYPKADQAYNQYKLVWVILKEY